jgi:hypothetical protein
MTPEAGAVLKDRLHAAAAEVTTLLQRLSSVRPGPPITSQDRRRFAEQAESSTESLTAVCDEVGIWIDLSQQPERVLSTTDVAAPNADAGTDVLDGVAAAQAELDEAGAQLHEAVEAARLRGDSWRTIGVSLGVTGQTAHKRFDPKARQRHADYMRARYQRAREAQVTD